MKLIFNPRNILEVGIKIYFEEKLLKEIILKQSIFLQEIDIPLKEPGKLQLQLVDTNELIVPEETRKASFQSEKEVITMRLDDCYSGTTAMGFRYPYKTVFPEINKIIGVLYLEFVSLEDLGVTAIIAKFTINEGELIQFNGKQNLERVPNICSFKWRRIIMWTIILILLLIMITVTIYLLISVLKADIRNTFEGQSWISLVAFIALALFVPIYAIYFRTRGAYEVLTKCDSVSVNDYKAEFISRYYEESQVSDSDDI